MARLRTDVRAHEPGEGNREIHGITEKLGVSSSVLKGSLSLQFYVFPLCSHCYAINGGIEGKVPSDSLEAYFPCTAPLAALPGSYSLHLRRTHTVH